MSGTNTYARGVKVLEHAQDEYSKGLTILDVNHNQVHEGNYYTASVYTGNIVAETGTFAIGILTGSKIVHYQPTDISVPDSSHVLVEFFEAGDFTGGSTTSVVNKNRNSTNTNTMTHYENITVNTQGTLLSSIHLLGSVGVGNRRVGGKSASEQEWILKPNTEYIAIFSNLDTNSTPLYLRAEWYEREV